ncbi:MAG: hypothetical protein CL424_07130 [Acidimicrobiaceae bacterium]|nr:hypothetical protein [Acidimicrobiaceae bacterium]
MSDNDYIRVENEFASVRVSSSGKRGLLVEDVRSGERIWLGALELSILAHCRPRDVLALLRIITEGTEFELRDQEKGLN